MLLYYFNVMYKMFEQLSHMSY